MSREQLLSFGKLLSPWNRSGHSSRFLREVCAGFWTMPRKILMPPLLRGSCGARRWMTASTYDTWLSQCPGGWKRSSRGKEQWPNISMYARYLFHEEINVFWFIPVSLFTKKIQNGQIFLRRLYRAGPWPHIPFPPDLILYVNLVAKGAPKFFKTLAPSLQYWISLTSLMHIVAPCVL